MFVQGVQGNVQGARPHNLLIKKACAGCVGCAGYIRGRARTHTQTKHDKKTTHARISTPHTLHTLHISVTARPKRVQGAFQYPAHPTHHQKIIEKVFCWNGNPERPPITSSQTRATKSAKHLTQPASSMAPGHHGLIETPQTTSGTTQRHEITQKPEESHASKPAEHASATTWGKADV